MLIGAGMRVSEIMETRRAFFPLGGGRSGGREQRERKRGRGGQRKPSAARNLKRKRMMFCAAQGLSRVPMCEKEKKRSKIYGGNKRKKPSLKKCERGRPIKKLKRGLTNIPSWCRGERNMWWAVEKKSGSNWSNPPEGPFRGRHSSSEAGMENRPTSPEAGAQIRT